MNSNTYDISVSTFQEIVIERSKELPVLVFFWSNQDPVCHQLLPFIDNIHSQDPDHFVFARVNCDVEEKIVAHFGVTNVPSVFFFKDGVAIDGFAGEQTNEFVSEFINKHTPDESETLFAQGQTLFAQGKISEAKECLIKALQLSPENNEVKLALAQNHLTTGAIESAKLLLDNIPMKDQNMIYHSLISQLELAVQSAQTPEITALESALEAVLESKEDKTAIQFKLALQYSQHQRNAEALELLINILMLDLGYENGDAKKTMLDILTTTDDAPLVSKYRRKLYSLLY